MPKCINCQLLKERVPGVCKQGPREYHPGYVWCKVSGREILSSEIYQELECSFFTQRIEKEKREK